MKKICILDYGLGNIKSLHNSIKKLGFNPEFYSENKCKIYDFIFIPGVGSFSKGSELIINKYKNFIIEAKNKNIPIFGICLGMQLLLTSGNENGKNPGLNLIQGKVEILSSNKDIILPAIGWNNVKFLNLDKYNFLKNYQKEKFYFIHSYVANLDSEVNILSTSRYHNIDYVSSIINERCIGTQFHPEKSGEIGLEFLKDWITKM